MEHYTSLTKADSTTSNLYLAPIITKLNLLPDGMTIVNDTNIKDSLGIKSSVFMRRGAIVIDYRLTANNVPAQVDICSAMFSNFIIPNYNLIYLAWIYRGANPSGSSWYGQNQCNHSSKKCLSDMTISDISSTCRECIDGSGCILAIEI